jgi:hypothetical protein
VKQDERNDRNCERPVRLTNTDYTPVPSSTASDERQRRTDDIELAAAFLFQAGDVVEIRIPEAGKEKTVSGYSDNPQVIAKLALQADRKSAGVYWTMNRVDPKLRARAQDRLQSNAKHTTTDANILVRRNLLLDIDATRPAGISSTDTEHKAALDMARGIRQKLMEEGWPQPMLQDSGNGAYLIFPLPDLPNDDATKDLVKRCLEALARRFNTELAHIDESTFNSSRIAKIPGTTARKGDNTADRPHRFSRLLDVPSVTEPVRIELLRRLASEVPPIAPRASALKRQNRRANRFDIDRWLTEGGLRNVGQPVSYNGGRKWVVQCPFNPEHSGTSAAVFEGRDGKLGFKCLHTSCADKDWKALRKHVDNGDGELRRICCNGRQLPAISDEALGALRAANDPLELFARGGAMVAVVHDENHRQVIVEVSVDSLCGRMARSAHYFKVGKKEKDGNSGEYDCPPPPVVVKDVLALPPQRWGFPSLHAITESPIVRRDGTILDTWGYDPGTKLYYSPDPNLRMPPIPECPKQADIQAARKLIHKTIGQFPYADDASYANTIAAMLTPIVRPAVEGCAPLGLFDAPQAGTGKSLLCDVVAIVATGQAGQMFKAPKDEDEWRKVITTALMSGTTVVIFDNVTRPLESGDLCSLLTSTTWADRAMKTHNKIALPVKATFLASGNNVRLGGDMPRRCYRIRLDAKCSQPFLRQGPKPGTPFQIEDLKAWALEHRGELLAALLTLTRAWYAAGQPKPKVKPLGSFERWTITVGGILEHAGFDGFLASAAAMYAEADDESREWEGFLLALHDIFCSEPFSVAEIVETLGETTWVEEKQCSISTARAQSLKDTLPERLASAMDHDGSFQTIAGKALASKADRRFGESGVHLMRGNVAHHAQQWKVEEVSLKIGEGREDGGEV